MKLELRNLLELKQDDRELSRFGGFLILSKVIARICKLYLLSLRFLSTNYVDMKAIF